MVPAVAALTGVDRARFETEILPAGQPVVLKGLCTDWPAVKAARQSTGAITTYLTDMDTSRKLTSVSLLAPELQGRFFFKPDMSGHNYGIDETSLTGILEWLLENEGVRDCMTIYAQSLLLSVYLPKFQAENWLDLLSGVEGRIWLGNRVRTQTHFDVSHNIACVVAGSRRFTLFPPEQIDNLYPGPFDVSPGGVPVSMASLEEPDFTAHPRFAEALKTATSAELMPGDAIYIPYGWWHHVQSMSDYNVLINYWWNEAGADWLSPMAGLYSAILTMRDLPQEQKRMWRHMLDRYVFDDPEAAVAHLPVNRRFGFGALTTELREKLKGIVRQRLRIP